MHSTDLIILATVVTACLLYTALVILAVHRQAPGLYQATFAVTAAGITAMTYAADGLGWAIGVATCFVVLYFALWRSVVERAPSSR